MKLTLQTQLLPERDHADRLKETVERFNEAANWCAGVAFERKLANKIELQKIVYRDIREKFGLSAQMAVRCIAQVCEAYKKDKTIRPEFRPHAAVPYDQRLMSFKGPDRVSLLTLGGRILVSVVMGKYQREQFTHAKGQADLVLRHDGRWFLLVTVDLPEDTPIPVTDFIGIDLGVVNIVTDSDGGQMSGEKVEKARRKYGDKHRRLQQAATERRQSGKRPRSIRRKIARDKAREARYKRDVNHCTAKAYVETAKGTGRGIAIEDLDGIRDRVTARGGDSRNRLSGWSFFQFRTFLTYKALLAGVPLVVVNPAYTSQDCAECGHRDRRNRKTQATFKCLKCGHTDNADVNAARNIRSRAIVMNAQGVGTCEGLPTEKPHASTGTSPAFRRGVS
jgi:putative transposase